MAATDLIKRLESNHCSMYSNDDEIWESLSELESSKIFNEMNEIDYGGKGLLSKHVTRVFDDTFTEYPPDSDSE